MFYFVFPSSQVDQRYNVQYNVNLRISVHKTYPDYDEFI